MPQAHSSPMLNRIVGLGLDGPASEEQLDGAIAAHGRAALLRLALARRRAGALGSWLAARGFEPSWGWMGFRRGVDDPPEAETRLTIGELGSERAAEFAALLRAAYGLPEELAPVIAALPELPGWRCFLALDGDEPAGAAALYVSGDSAYLGLAGTAAEHRGKGAQSALLAARIRCARELGCDEVFTETGERVPDRPSASYRNIVRAGFEELRVVPNWLSPAP